MHTHPPQQLTVFQASQFEHRISPLYTKGRNPVYSTVAFAGRMLRLEGTENMPHAVFICFKCKKRGNIVYVCVWFFISIVSEFS
jgi:hypothetical protein